MPRARTSAALHVLTTHCLHDLKDADNTHTQDLLRRAAIDLGLVTSRPPPRYPVPLRWDVSPHFAKWLRVRVANHDLVASDPALPPVPPALPLKQEAAAAKPPPLLAKPPPLLAKPPPLLPKPAALLPKPAALLSTPPLLATPPLPPLCAIPVPANRRVPLLPLPAHPFQGMTPKEYNAAKRKFDQVEQQPPVRDQRKPKPDNRKDASSRPAQVSVAVQVDLSDRRDTSELIQRAVATARSIAEDSESAAKVKDVLEAARRVCENNN